MAKIQVGDFYAQSVARHSAERLSAEHQTAIARLTPDQARQFVAVSAEKAVERYLQGHYPNESLQVALRAVRDAAAGLPARLPEFDCADSVLPSIFAVDADPWVAARHACFARIDFFKGYAVPGTLPAGVLPMHALCVMEETWEARLEFARAEALADLEAAVAA